MEYPDRYTRRVVITVAIIGAVYIAWEVRAVVMIVFGGLIIATLLTAMSNKIGQLIPVKRKVAVAIAIFIIVLVFVLAGWWIGGNIATQLSGLRDKLPDAIDASVEWLQQYPLGASILSQQNGVEEFEVPWDRIAGFTGSALGAMANAVLIIALGVYIAASPGLYGSGLIRLIPPGYQAQTAEAIRRAANGLRQWLLGQLMSMAIVGMLFAAGLKALDIPFALSLGIIAGLLEFIPFIGPFAFGFLAVLLAFTESPIDALHVAILCLAIQQLEGSVITPLVQRRAVKLPPALGLVAVLIFATLFGLIGILFATPMMVVVMILVQRLYIECALEADRPGSSESPPQLGPDPQE